MRFYLVHHYGRSIHTRAYHGCPTLLLVRPSNPRLRRWSSIYVCSQMRSLGWEGSSWFILNLFTMSQHTTYHLSHKGPYSPETHQLCWGGMDRMKRNHPNAVLIVQPENIHTTPRYQWEVSTLVKFKLATVGEKKVDTPTIPC